LIAAMAASLLFVAVSACTPTRTQKSAGEQIDDTVLTAKVKTALIGDAETKARDIDVEVFRGIVQLNGFVNSSAEKSQATRVARGVTGVKEVHNNLTLDKKRDTAGEAIDDATITTKVKAALAEDGRTNALQVNVETENGVVQLSGFVNNGTAKGAAESIARGVAGVRSVKNEIDVK
jgi:hyperosmotically inducible protein